MLRAALLVTVALLAGAAPAHAAGKIVFADRDCSLWAPTSVPDPCPGTISVAREDGTGAVRVTDGAAAGGPTYGGDGSPDWSPDGRRIAFTRMYLREPPDADTAPNRGKALWTMNADGSGQRQVLAPEEGARFLYQASPMWTADGTRIVFSGERWREPARLYSVRPDGTDLRPITPEGVHAEEPATTPDGGVTYMTSSSGSAGSQAPHGLETTIWRVEPATGEQAQIFFGDIMLGFASVSPTGRWMALHTARADAYRIQTLALDGSGLVDRLAADAFNRPTVWAGPERLLLRRWVGEAGATHDELWALDLERGGGPQRISEDFPGGRYDWHPGGEPEPSGVQDELPPVVLTTPPPKPATASAARVRRYARIPLIAADGSGLARVEVSLARVAKGRCRYATPAGRTGPARSCTRPRWRTIDGVAAWRRMTDPLPRGRYALRVRARDTEGNRTRGGKVRKLILRSAPR